MGGQPKLLFRSQTLAQAIRLIVDGRPEHACLVGFLDEFYWDRDSTSRRARVEEAPKLIGDERKDA
jgi:hypothetical protein